MCCLVTFWCGLYFSKRSFHCLNCSKAVLEVMHWCAGKVFWGCVVGGQVLQSILLAFQDNVAVCYRKMHPVTLPKKYWCCWRMRYSKCKFEVKWDKLRVLVTYCHLSVREVLLQIILKISSQCHGVIDCFILDEDLRCEKKLERYLVHTGAFFSLSFWKNSDEIQILCVLTDEMILRVIAGKLLFLRSKHYILGFRYQLRILI